ncbi:MAG: methionine--tRNA ligase [Chloroflexi bacterium]|nr:methionine--tRNA ligase [Chloroflexota bacterium]
MTECIFIGVAWPYANGPLHLGHIAGAYLPADIFARYNRLKGNDIVMVSGADQHGTPITIRAEQEGKTPQQVADYYHKDFSDSFNRLGISFDLFTSTGTANHSAIVQDFFMTLYKKGYIYKASTLLPYCTNCKRFLPDRYIEGKCPACNYEHARGDQCDICGKPMNPTDLVDPHCRICNCSPEFKESEHFFLKLSAFSEQLLPWVQKQTHWRKNAQNFTIGFLNEGLEDRAITRDIEWGIPIPVPGFENKRIYVWFEAVIGYLSATKEWANKIGKPEKWQDFWKKECKSYYFVGKDNIPFHTIIWPAMLMGYENLNLPYDVAANEFLTLEGKKLSTSRNWAVWLPYYLEKYDPDALRYYLSINMPETNDADFSWNEFVRRNNNELVATYGNLVHRTLTQIYRNFEGKVPSSVQRTEASLKLLQKAKDTTQIVSDSLATCSFRNAIRAIMTLAQDTNRYLDESAPWKEIKLNREAATASLVTTLEIICYLKTMLYPFLPHSSTKLHHLLGFKNSLESAGWTFTPPQAGQQLETPVPLFSKLDDSVVELEMAKLRADQQGVA